METMITGFSEVSTGAGGEGGGGKEGVTEHVVTLQSV